MNNIQHERIQSYDASRSMGTAFRYMIPVFSVLIGLIMYIETMLVVSLPSIALQYHVSIAETSLIVALYALAGVAISPLVGRLGDAFGNKKIFIFFLMLYVVSVAMTSFSPSFEFLLISRTIQGAGMAMLPLIMSIIVKTFPRETIPKKTGLLRGVVFIGSSLGLPLGGYISSIFGWQGNYHIVLPIMIVVGILSVIIVRRIPDTKTRTEIDVMGGIWFGISIGAIVLALGEGPTWGWKSPITITLIVLGFVLLIPLMLYERKIKDPILHIELLKQRNMVVSVIALFAMTMSAFLAYQVLTYQFQLEPPSGYGLGLITTGIYLLPFGLSPLIMSIAVGSIIPKYGIKPFLYIGSVSGAVGFFMLSIADSPDMLSVFAIVAAIGLSTISISGQTLILLSIKKSRMGLANGLVTAFTGTGNSIGAALAASIISTFLSTYYIRGSLLILPSNFAFKLIYYIAVSLMILALLTSVFSKEAIGKKADRVVLMESKS